MSGKVARAPELLWRRTADRVILLGSHGGELQTLLGTGVDVWELLATPRSADSIAEALAERYQADAATVRSDVDDLLERLAAGAALVHLP